MKIYLLEAKQDNIRELVQETREDVKKILNRDTDHASTPRRP